MSSRLVRMLYKIVRSSSLVTWESIGNAGIVAFWVMRSRSRSQCSWGMVYSKFPSTLTPSGRPFWRWANAECWSISLVPKSWASRQVMGPPWLFCPQITHWTYSCKTLIYKATWIYFDEHHELYVFILKVLRCLSSRLTATSVCDFNLNDCKRTTCTPGTSTDYCNIRFSLCVTICTLYCTSNVKWWVSE